MKRQQAAIIKDQDALNHVRAENQAQAAKVSQLAKAQQLSGLPLECLSAGTLRVTASVAGLSRITGAVGVRLLH